MDEKLFPDTSSYYKKTNKRPRGILVILLLLILLLVGLFVGLRYFGGEAGSRIQGMLPVTPTPSPELPTPTAAEDPTPTPAEEDPTPTAGKNAKTTTTPEPTARGGLTRSALSVSVQNGSGVSGAAAKMATALRELGYNVTSTGNADTFDFEDVTIKVKPTKKNYLTQLRSDLAKDFTIAEATADLAGSEKADAVVIVGE